ncbi:MAG: 16S rRNA (adenine(1518)-N(6)/adenine(1519)-N(6))-dimethyltransferase RsmA [Acholeplasmatales bacterium]|jgi:16S rRNA (adenine1518-N6/adenine1519-N6)-dimethyltransferase|nr:16S rRNA (adenine(1518)-N(6)/adenine(1519)-N(6))-dimethyltransferase RsmA [Acholeplasmataceae bacterium]MCK9289667.1 16S rRNA (adenine(1518)-N(6)/adenine(1519)-N(6))-dimethyltransferase RsmA [Acholeplasmataceae bacterium]MCK9427468.1 16S rRNA (adenine(1518)-N(6)/adenine(1519)-N(6))-dimethyltransferase RsmA [Acholeplasmataceae bacterium]MDY0115148.1 16S rRNA (adenine(1518)-N(6)/adenine(1519)-N(6))-dimethyltransferase RsmA [Acholeplasmatales bacterium]HHT39963.1 ribosomal RNA small subunit met
MKKKYYGQHFLNNKKIINEIVNVFDLTNKTVIEIGPGAGALSRALLTKALFVYGFEIDTDLKETLLKLEREHHNFKVIYQDILTVDLNTFMKEKKLKESYLIANIPYYITGPILMKLLETEKITKAIIMMQKEVGLRLLAKAGKSYNSLSVYMQTFYELKKERLVKRTNFNPPPLVDSIIISFVKKDDYLKRITNLDNYLEFVKFSFVQKRKTLVNNLSTSFKLPKDEVIKKLMSIDLNYNPLTRAESLTIENFISYSEGWYRD